jgi:hypothetical protein
MADKPVVKNPVLAHAMAGIGLVETPAPKAKAGKVAVIKRRDMSLEQVDSADTKALEENFSAARIEALEEIYVLAEETRWETSTRAEKMVECCAIMYPTRKPTWAQHSAATNYLRTRSQVAYRAYIKALRRYLGKTLKDGTFVPGELPTATKGAGAKRKANGGSPRVWIRGLDSDMRHLTDRINTIPARDIDRNVLRDFLAQYRALTAMVKVLHKAVA